MSILKPVPIVPQVVRKLCPYCGKASYSRDGIHPQCALAQADDRRSAVLRERRKQAEKVEKPARRIYSKKCPGCGTQVHVRLATCECGHTFATRA